MHDAEGSITGKTIQSTTLLQAVYKDHQEAANLSTVLLDHKADLDLADSDGFTPLMAAAQEGRLSILDTLPYHGAAIDAVNKYGWSSRSTALALAKHGCDMTLRPCGRSTARRASPGGGRGAAAVRARTSPSAKAAPRTRSC